MTSQLMVKINVAPFSQVNKTKVGVSGELLSVSRSQENNPRITEKSAESIRIAQLEQNIKFLQEQHQTLLNDLHNEIETLRIKNRDLQFQLILSKNQPASPATSTSTSSSDDEHKISSSPNQTPFTSSLHVELLEKMIGDLKIQLQENESKNAYLSTIVDEQKKKLDDYDKEKEVEKSAVTEPDLRRKVEEADSIIRRLQQENNSLRTEHTASPPHYHFSKGDSKEHAHNNAHSNHRENGGYHNQNGSFQKSGRGSRRNNSSNNYRGNWFPPLQTQNYWQSGGNRGGINVNHQQDKKNQHYSSSDGTMLPNLKGNPHHYHYERRNNGNNHYGGGGGGSSDGGRHRTGQHREFSS